jgi:integrase
MFLSKHKNGTYYIIYEKMNGKRGCKSTKTKLKKVALKKLGAFQKQLEIEKTQEVIPIRLNQFAFNFLRSSEPYYTDNTVKVYKCTFNTVKEHFGDALLTDLSTQELEKFLLMRAKETSIYAARKDLSNLSCAFNRAVRDGYLIKNPCQGIKRFKLPERPPLFYSEDEYKKLLDAIDDETIKDIVQIAVNTGMRQMELLRLEWSQINFEDALITLDNRGHITKTKRVRSLPMNNVVTEILKKIKLNTNGSNYIFIYKGEPFEQKYFSKYFKKFVLKAKVNPKLNFHSLRHTFASWLVQRQVSIYVVSRLLGHSNISTTEQYSHLRRDDLKGAVDILN